MKRKVQAQRKFAQGAYIPPSASNTSNTPSTSAERREIPLAAEPSRITYNNMSASNLLDYVAYGRKPGMQEMNQLYISSNEIIPQSILDKIDEITDDVEPLAKKRKAKTKSKSTRRKRATTSTLTGGAPFQEFATMTDDLEDDQPLKYFASTSKKPKRAKRSPKPKIDLKPTRYSQRIASKKRLLRKPSYTMESVLSQTNTDDGDTSASENIPLLTLRAIARCDDVVRRRQKTPRSESPSYPDQRPCPKQFKKLPCFTDGLIMSSPQYHNKVESYQVKFKTPWSTYVPAHHLVADKRKINATPLPPKPIIENKAINNNTETPITDAPSSIFQSSLSELADPENVTFEFDPDNLNGIEVSWDDCPIDKGSEGYPEEDDFSIENHMLLQQEKNTSAVNYEISCPSTKYTTVRDIVDASDEILDKGCQLDSCPPCKRVRKVRQLKSIVLSPLTRCNEYTTDVYEFNIDEDSPITSYEEFRLSRQGSGSNDNTRSNRPINLDILTESTHVIQITDLDKPMMRARLVRKSQAGLTDEFLLIEHEKLLDQLLEMNLICTSYDSSNTVTPLMNIDGTVSNLVLMPVSPETVARLENQSNSDEEDNKDIIQLSQTSNYNVSISVSVRDNNFDYVGPTASTIEGIDDVHIVSPLKEEVDSLEGDMEDSISEGTSNIQLIAASITSKDAVSYRDERYQLYLRSGLNVFEPDDEIEDQPSSSTNEPSCPTNEPSFPTNEPSLPAKEPSLPAKEPSLPAKEPSFPTNEPAGLSSPPVIIPEESVATTSSINKSNDQSSRSSSRNQERSGPNNRNNFVIDGPSTSYAPNNNGGGTDPPIRNAGCEPNAKPQHAELQHAEPQLAEPQHDKPQPAEPQPAEPQHDKPQHAEPQPAEPQHDKPQHAEPQHDKLQPAEPQHDKPQHNKPQPAEPQHNKPQPAEPQHAEPQPAKPQPAEPQHDKPQPAEPQHDKPQPAEPQPAEPQHDKPQPAEPQHDKPQPAEPQPAKPQPAEPQHDKPQPAEPQHAQPQQAQPPAQSCACQINRIPADTKEVIVIEDDEEEDQESSDEDQPIRVARKSEQFKANAMRYEEKRRSARQAGVERAIHNDSFYKEHQRRAKSRTRQDPPGKNIPGTMGDVPVDPADLRDAPVFHPTESEFADPIEYFQKIAPSVAKFGLCKVVPPQGFKPTCYVDDEIRFNVSNQYITRMYNRWGPASREMCVIKAYLTSHCVRFYRAPLFEGIEVNLPKLYHVVQRHGGLKNVIEKKKWSRVAAEMNFNRGPNPEKKVDQLYVKYLLPYETLSCQERQEKMAEVELNWLKKVQILLQRARKPLRLQSWLLGESDASDEEFKAENNCTTALEEIEDCVLAGRQMNLTSFNKVSTSAMDTFFPGNSNPDPREVEREYWRHVLLATEHVCVYSASVDTSAANYGFPTDSENPYSSHPWNLKRISENSGNVLRSLGKKRGVTIPTLHLGMIFSTSCWHRDPHGLPWVEYMHSGPTKIWYGISDDQSERFRKAVETLCPTFCQNKKTWLPSDITMIPPNLFKEHNVSLARVEQNPGEFVVVYPKAYTCSICTGYTVSESVYFAFTAWLHIITQVFQEVRESCEPTMFAMEQLLLAVARDPRASLREAATAAPIVASVLRDEINNRNLLSNLETPHAPNGIPDTVQNSEETSQPSGAWNRRDRDECYCCRCTLFLSKVKGLPKKNTYVCLLHALRLFEIGYPITTTQLISNYSVNDLESFITAVECRVNAVG